MAEIIEPRTLRGFRDSLPQSELLKARIQEKLVGIFQQFGFVPIDTPALEYAEILLGKGGGETDKQVYRFRDQGRRDVALRFDLTVSFARFMASHLPELYLPFKRYHIAKVWRGENTQRGRYREFIQVDFDIVGVDAASADAEILLVMQACLAALGIEEFHIHFSHRELFSQFLKALGLGKQYLPILRAIDKLRKLGEGKVRELLAEIGAGSRIEEILAFVRLEDSNGQTLRKLASGVAPDSEPLARLKSIRRCLQECELESFFRIDPSVTRGLDYYTGVVFETYLDQLPEIGSICAGGRYNDLASLFTRERLPGVGSSIGLDRLVAALEELRLAQQPPAAPDVLILMLEPALLGIYHKLAVTLHQAGLSAEVYPAERKLAVQLRYAERRCIPLAVFCGGAEAQAGLYNLRDLRTRASYDGLPLQALLETASGLRQL